MPTSQIHTGIVSSFCLLALLTGCGSSGKDPAKKPVPAPKAKSPSTAAQPVQPDEPAIFSDATEALGLRFTHTVGTAGSYFFPQIAAGGGAMLDYDGDGRLDIYLVNGNLEHDSDDGETGSNKPTRITNRLFHQKPDGTFEDVTTASGLGDASYGLGAAVADVNNDGHPDIYVTNYRADRLFLNRGNGTFQDITKSAGIDNLRWGSSACFLDYDRDGRLDLFITNYINHQPGRKCEAGDGHEDFCGPSTFSGTIDKLYHNVSDADGVRFEDVTASSGIGSQRGPGLGATAADFTGDGYPDIYVANDGAANFLWVNQHDGTFVDDAILQAVSHDAQGRAQAGMGIAVADIDSDLRLDLFVTHLDGESNALYASGGDAHGFSDAAVSDGLGVASYPMTGFGTAFFDVDCDGDNDLVVANGRVVRSEFKQMAPVTEFWSDYTEVNQLFMNDGGRFRPRHSTTDPLTTHEHVSRGLSIGDIDNDGDIDVLIINAAGSVKLYRNELSTRGSFLVIRAVDPSVGGRDSIGARITLSIGETRRLGVVQPGSSYLSSHDPRVHFGLGEAQRVDQIEITWPDGSTERFGPSEANLHKTLRKGEGEQP